MNVLQAALLGLVQGVTEFFPVSSTGHLTLVGKLLGAEGATSLMFMIMLHLGTLVAVLSVFYKDILRIIAETIGILADAVTNLKIYIAEHKQPEGRRYIKILSNGYRKFTALILISLIPTILVAFLVSPIVEMLAGNLLASGLGLFVTALLLFVSSFMRYADKGPRDAKILDAVLVGAFQGFGAFPGNSRLAMALSSGFLSGFSRKFALKYAFVLSVPTVIGALILEAGRYQAGEAAAVGVLPCAVGMLVSAAVGFFVIRIVLKLLNVKRNRFFAGYCLVIGILSIIGYLY